MNIADLDICRFERLTSCKIGWASIKKCLQKSYVYIYIARYY